MSSATAQCPDCSTAYEPADNYCRKCGMYVAALNDAPSVAVVNRTSYALDRPRAQLPAPVKRAATAIAIGAALQVGMSLAGRYLVSQAAKAAVDATVRGPRRAPARATGRPAGRTVAPLDDDDAAAVAETLIYRRVWLRRP